MQEAAMVRALAAFVILCALAITAIFEPVEPDEQDCLARGKSESCMTEAYWE